MTDMVLQSKPILERFRLDGRVALTGFVPTVSVLLDNPGLISGFRDYFSKRSSKMQIFRNSLYRDSISG